MFARIARSFVVPALVALAVGLTGPAFAQETTAASIYPVATWVSPASGSTFPAYSTITLTATASTTSGSITSVMFYNTANGRILGIVSTAPYTFNWANVPPGTYTIRALARNSLGKGGNTAAITLVVNGSNSGGGSSTPPPPPPTTYALTVNGGSGSGQYTAGTVVSIAAGTPPPGQIFKQWTGASVADPASASTKLTMPAASTSVTATYVTPPPIPQPVTAHPRLWMTPADVTRLQGWATPTNPVYQQGLLPVLNRAVVAYQTQFFPGGVANPNYPDPGDINGYGSWQTYASEQYAMVLAFNALIDPNPANRVTYARYARNILMYAMNKAAQGFVNGAPFQDPQFPQNNRANYYGEMWPLIVDWLYNATDANNQPILTAADKLTIQKAFLLWANDCAVGYYPGGADHPQFYPTVNSPALLPGNKANRMTGNNYYSGHARLLTMMALALDPADDPPVNPNTPASVLGNTVRSYISYATGAFLYQQYALYGEPANVAADLGLPGTGAGLGIASGGLPPEGMLYGHSYGYILGQLLALQTAGFNDPSLSGPQVALIDAPVWGRFARGWISSMTPAAQILSSMPYLGTAYQIASYGDLLRLWVTPETMQTFALLALLEQQQGKTANTDVARWFAVNALNGGAGNLYGRMTNPWDFMEPVLYFMLLDPAAAPAADPRPAWPTTFTDPGLGRLLAHSDWGAGSSLFTFKSGWTSINHQDADAGQFELFRNGQWLTKELSNYDNNMIGQNSPYHNTLALQNTTANGLAPNLFWFEPNEYLVGSQYVLGLSAGDPVTLTSSGPGYAFGFTDMTKSYNRPSTTTPMMAITHASRSVLWVNGDFVVAYDRATSSASGLFKRFNLCLATQPVVSQAGGTTVAVETVAGGQQLFVQTLLPAAPSTSVVDGVAGITTLAETEPMRYIYTVEDASRPNDVRFLHVLQGADAGAPMVPAARIQSVGGSAMDGAVFGSVAVFFVVDATAPLGGTTLSVPAGVSTVYVTGLAPNTGYQVSVVPGAGATTITVSLGAGGQTSDAAGLLKISF